MFRQRLHSYLVGLVNYHGIHIVLGEWNFPWSASEWCTVNKATGAISDKLVCVHWEEESTYFASYLVMAPARQPFQDTSCLCFFEPVGFTLPWIRLRSPQHSDWEGGMATFLLLLSSPPPSLHFGCFDLFLDLYFPYFSVNLVYPLCYFFV